MASVEWWCGSHIMESCWDGGCESSLSERGGGGGWRDTKTETCTSSRCVLDLIQAKTEHARICIYDFIYDCLLGISGLPSGNNRRARGEWKTT